MNRKSILALCLFATLLCADAHADDSARHHAYDLAGRLHRLAENPATRTTVLVFLGTECPISQRAIPSLNRLFANTTEQPIEFFGVIAGHPVHRAEAAKFATDFGLKFPVLFDDSGELARWLKPTHVPEAFVADARGDLLYHGRIDDAYEGLGRPRSSVTREYLKDAIDAAIAGKPQPLAKTDPVGCLFEDAPTNSTKAPVTFNRNIAPILYAQCSTCHRSGEVAPFTLLSYTDAAKRARQIAKVVDQGLMPPWKAEPGYGHFVDERRLTDREKQTIAAWAGAGAPEGDPADALAPPQYADGWQLGKPDLVIRMPEPFDIPADGPDLLQNFVIPLDVPQDKAVGAVEFRPGNRRAVHHALCFLDANGAARRMDQLDPGPGYSATIHGLGFLPTGGLAGWAPGMVPRWLPDGMGRRLRKGSDAVLQVHYHPTGKPERDQSEVGVYFVRKPVNHYVAGIAVENWDIDIPPGARQYDRSASYTLPTETIILGVTPHMHLLGTRMKAWAELPDGNVQPLINIGQWDFNWQDTYVYRQPLHLPAGTVLKMQASFDNSPENPANPSRGTRRITFGEGTADEMCLCFFEVTCDDVRELIRLVGDNVRSRNVLERAIRKALARKLAP